MDRKRDPNSGTRTREGYARALKRELAGYVAAGDRDRAKGVELELARIGAGEEPLERTVPAQAERAEAVKSKPARAKARG